MSGTSSRLGKPADQPRARPGRLVMRIADRLPNRVTETVSLWWRSLLALLPTKARLPPVSVDLRSWLPCWALRIAAAALAFAAAALVMEGVLGWTITGVLLVLIILRPKSPAAAVLAVVVGFSLVQRSEEVWAARGPLLLFTLHASVTLCVLLGATSWAARVQLAVLARPLPRFAVIQLVSQLLGALGMLLVGQQLSWPWVPVIAAAAALTLVIVWLPRLGAREELRPSQVERLLDKATSRRWGED